MFPSEFINNNQLEVYKFQDKDGTTMTVKKYGPFEALALDETYKIVGRVKQFGKQLSILVS